MPEIFLPEEVSLSDAITRLDLHSVPLIRALRTILMYSDKHGLELHFKNTEIYGYETDKPIDELRDDHNSDDITGLMTIEDPVLFDSSMDLKLLLSTGCTSNGVDYFIGTHSFQFDKIDYYTTDDTQQWLESRPINMKYFFINKDDLLKFIEAMNSAESSPSLENKKTIPYPESMGVLTALALLARHHADSSNKFKYGNKVNVSAFRNLILKLAEEHNVTNNGLKKIDDKISPVLDEHDIRELKQPVQPIDSTNDRTQ